MSDRAAFLERVREAGDELEYASHQLKNNREVVMAAVGNDGLALEYASEELKNNIEVVMAAIGNNGRALTYASNQLKEDREVVMAAIGNNYWALEYASDELINNREVVMAAVGKYGQGLQYASNELKNDRELMMAAVGNDGWALKYASVELKNNRELMMAAVGNNGRALTYASNQLKNDREVVMAAVGNDGWALEYASVELKNDKEVVMAAVGNDGVMLEYASNQLKEDREVVMAAVGNDGRALEYTSKGIKGDKEIVIAAVGKCIHVWSRYVDQSLFGDEDVIRLFAKHLRESGEGDIFEAVDNEHMAPILGGAVKMDRSIAFQTNDEGKRAIYIARPTCQEAMKAGLRFLGTFDVDKVPPLHLSKTSCVFAAAKHEGDKEFPVALKAMREVDQVLNEIRGRTGVDTEYMVGIQAVYVAKNVVAEYRKLVEKECSNKELAFHVTDLFEEAVYALIKERNKGERRRKYEKQKGAEDANSNSTSATRGHGYQYLLVLDFGDRSLSDAISHEHITGGNNPFIVRKIMSDLGQALQMLHETGRIHADLKGANTVRVGLKWVLTDMDAACEIDKEFGSKAPSSGCCPPEMAKILLAASTDETAGNINHLKTYKGNIAYDLWSFGILLYHLVKGRPLWSVNKNYDVDPNVLLTINNITSDNLRKNQLHLKRGSSSEDKCAYDLIRKLLEPNPEVRLKNFGLMKMVLDDHPFFLSMGVDDPAEEKIVKLFVERFDKVDVGLRKIDERTKRMEVNLVKLSEQLQYELVNTRKVLLKGIFEATDVHCPTVFVISNEELPEAEIKLNHKLIIGLKEDCSGFEFSEFYKTRFDKGMKWIDRLKDFGAGVATGDPDKVFGPLKDYFKELIEGEKYYLYLIDELTGAPVSAGPYPIEITIPSEVVPKLMPLMEVGMKAMSLYNGVGGICRMFCVPVPKMSEWLDGANQSIELLKQESLVEKFGMLHEEVISANKSDKKTVRGESLRQLEEFLKEKDEKNNFAGLRRVGAHNGMSVWTTLNDHEIPIALEARAKERQLEEETTKQSADKRVKELENGKQSVEERVKELENGKQSAKEKEMENCIKELAFVWDDRMFCKLEER